MKIINMKKFITRIIDLVIIIATTVLTPMVINYANAWRGYKGFGGEYLIPILGLVIVMIIETIYEESSRR